jgi:hypothetical protein
MGLFSNQQTVNFIWGWTVSPRPTTSFPSQKLFFLLPVVGQEVFDVVGGANNTKGMKRLGSKRSSRQQLVVG